MVDTGILHGLCRNLTGLIQVSHMADTGVLHGLCRNLTGFLQVFYRRYI